MIVGFNVSNFRSFLTEQSLSFLATADSSHQATHCVATRFHALPRLTRTAVLFGPNASGKSNLLTALRTMREFVLNSCHFSEADYRDRYMPFRAVDAIDKPTTFAIDVLLEGLRFRYSFAYDAERIVAENLRVHRNSKSQRWFGRRLLGPERAEDWTPFSAGFQGARELWRKATRPRALFLTTASQLGAEPFAPLMHWFEHQLDIALSDDVNDLQPFALRLQDPEFKRNVVRIMQAVDIPVIDVRVAEPKSVGQPQLPSVEFAYAREGLAPIWLDSQKDSSGARKLAALLSPLLDGIERDRFVAIDEFDTHLHPLVARFLIQIITDPACTHRRVQVLLVSHTTTLMDLTILRRDEVWLIDTDKRRSSRLNTLMGQSPRKHEIVAKAYLRGTYGAVPRIASIDPRAAPRQNGSGQKAPRRRVAKHGEAQDRR